jgi:hypothetical protein
MIESDKHFSLLNAELVTTVKGFTEHARWSNSMVQLEHPQFQTKNRLDLLGQSYKILFSVNAILL